MTALASRYGPASLTTGRIPDQTSLPFRDMYLTYRGAVVEAKGRLGSSKSSCGVRNTENLCTESTVRRAAGWRDGNGDVDQANGGSGARLDTLS